MPFTDGELLAARIRIAARECAAAMSRFIRAWDVATANIRAARQAEQDLRDARIAAAEMFVLRQRRPSGATVEP